MPAPVGSTTPRCIVCPQLDGRHELRAACTWFQGNDVDTDQIIDYLRTMRLASNVELGEVAQVDLRDLRGVDDVIRSLEANIVIPLEDGELRRSSSCNRNGACCWPGRRAPGRRQSVVARSSAQGEVLLDRRNVHLRHAAFLSNISRVFHEAKENAPSIIFIDDSDVIFESGAGARPLSLLADDARRPREQKRSTRCVMWMTVMDVGNLPPALIRSGRVELWLEMRLPDDSARRAILGQLVSGLPAVPSAGPMWIRSLPPAMDLPAPT